VSWPDEGIEDLGFLTMGSPPPPDVRTAFGAGASALRHRPAHPPRRAHRTLADLGAYETANDPDKRPARDGRGHRPDGAYALNNREVIVADSAANDILSVTRTGDIKLLAVIPFGSATAPPGIPGLPAGTRSRCSPCPTSVTSPRTGRSTSRS
jgi:hypothetical protein